MEENRFRELAEYAFLRRDPHANKSTYGKTLLIGGSSNYPGAISLAAIGATSAAPGYVAISPDESVAEIVKNRAPLTCVFPAIKSDVSQYDSICFGNGIENKGSSTDLLRAICRHLKPEQRLIIDATGLDVFANIAAEFPAFAENVLLTPHPGEARRLFGLDKEATFPADYIKAAQSFSAKYGVIVLLKNFESVVVDAKQTRTSEYAGVPSLAKAGSGDVLAGFLAGLSAYLWKKASLAEIAEFGDLLFHRSFKALEETKPAALIKPDDFPEGLLLYLK
ncbi:MAG: ADP/ATP-dependent (S)-NAD(P)H-hydrate dehydratase [Bacillota bacterium]|nr:ADP/ATP-dependent (S)-NAD(P)H-hydrate dehydratase [Bacillota bacterium]